MQGSHSLFENKIANSIWWPEDRLEEELTVANFGTRQTSVTFATCQPVYCKRQDSTEFL